ncbi:hypothetical protein B0H10DRAFT_2166218 [Mycena sp. CBHHK59/15]|nr:hypothetical protein B0H10DRAFT_2166218 [Mycena sp. CBHHK59/15]
MSLSTMSNFIKQKSSLGPTNGRQTVGDGAALYLDTEPTVLAVCHLQGTDDMYYYSTTFSGGPEVSPFHLASAMILTAPVAVLTSLNPNALPIEGSPAPNLSDSNYFPNYYPSKPSFNASHPRPIPASRAPPAPCNSDLATPPLTPDDGSDFGGSPAVSDKNQKDALDFLMTVFPHHGVGALPFSRSVSISAPNMGVAFEGVVLELPGKPKTLYVDGKVPSRIVALLDLADENLECSALVIVLERSSPTLGEILHSLMYPPYEVDPAFVLVGMEI